MKTISKLMLTIALLLPAAALTQTSVAQAGGLDCLGCSLCPKCDNCCSLSVDQVDVEKHCWEIECKQICIPKIVFPWQKADCCGQCVENGARIKTIKVLKKHKYTCPECEYTWTPSAAGCCGACCGSKCCDSGCGHGCDSGCDSACCAAPMGIEMGPSVPVPAPAPQGLAPQPYDAPVHADPAPSVLNPQSAEAPSASMLKVKKVQAVSFVRELFAR
ncbi:hypothetical protein [Roseimaritima ulvae]|uniref:TNFR-Cys domain-containing protein n=1 Tax=Roseimaritima ulvae TaxID=980254 RepID=A0A5B9R8R5_9BACT|nr:hypothetical protein [Roseimaritima ulvae]QEG43063.1 hypothetical protein UC8_51070 [Roseimaritima ulvae]